MQTHETDSTEKPESNEVTGTFETLNGKAKLHAIPGQRSTSGKTRAGKSPKVTLDNLLDRYPLYSDRSNAEGVEGLIVGGYSITKIVSQRGSHGLVVACIDETKATYAMKIEAQLQEMEMDNLALTGITHQINCTKTCTFLDFTEGSKKGEKKSPSWTY